MISLENIALDEMYSRNEILLSFLRNRYYCRAYLYNLVAAKGRSDEQ